MPFCSMLMPLQTKMEATHVSQKAKTHLLEARKSSTKLSYNAFDKMSQASSLNFVELNHSLRKYSERETTKFIKPKYTKQGANGPAMKPPQ